MALIPIWHLIPAKAAIDTNSNEISMGMCVAWNGANGIRRVTTGGTRWLIRGGTLGI